MILLDTHALVWWVSEPRKLSRAALRAIEGAKAAEGVTLSSMSAWEVAMLNRAGRLSLTMDVAEWLARVEALPFVRFVPVDNAIALKSVRLPEPFHRDPADRIIAATAIIHGASLVTVDDKLRQYPHLRTIW